MLRREYEICRREDFSTETGKSRLLRLLCFSLLDAIVFPLLLHIFVYKSNMMIFFCLMNQQEARETSVILSLPGLLVEN